MAIRTTTTRTTSSACGPSADSTVAPYPFSDLVQAYYDCRRSKRNSTSALAFEARLERNLSQLHSDLIAGTYRPGRSICFVVTRPKPREVWAADFRDRIVHHLLYNRIGASIEATFIADSCAAPRPAPATEPISTHSAPAPASAEDSLCPRNASTWPGL